MAISNPIVAVVLFFLLFEKPADCNDVAPPSTNDDASSIPMIASGKRMHNIMRFGKRVADGENVLDYEKRESSKAPQHSFLYFGKRENEEDSTLPDRILQYLQESYLNTSNKRSSDNVHNIMRFGKRSPDGSSVFGYGNPDGDDSYGYLPNGIGIDEDKRGGHSMMYFGKRGGHNMMYFGKRAPGHNMLSFGKRAAGHNILSFGKRAAGHSILSFGKRDEDKRAHSMIHFGKRDGDEDDLSEESKRGGGHAMFHFGKREGDEDFYPEELKRGGGHAMFHFGKRDDDEDVYPEELKRASHAMIHFGKRDFGDEPVPFFWNPAASERDQQQNMYRYGKKTGKNNHAMIHFGKRDAEKRAHAMIHFGKRSVEEVTTNNAAGTNNQSKNTPSNAATRTKRDLEAVGNPDPLVTLIRYDNNEDDYVGPEEDIENAIKESQSTVYYPGGIINPLPYAIDPVLSISPEYRPLLKKEASKNMFMRFG